MLGVACGGVLGADSKHEKKFRMTSSRGQAALKGFFRGDFPNSRTEEDSALRLVSKYVELSISYVLLRNSIALTLSNNKLF